MTTTETKQASRKSLKNRFRKYIRGFGLGPGIVDRAHMRYMGYGPIPLSFKQFIAQ